MANYTIDQAQRDIANTRFLVQALQNSVSGLFVNPVVTNSITLPDGSTWTVSGPTLHAPLPIAQGGTGANSAATALSNLGAAPTASPTFTGTVTLPDGSTITVTAANIAKLLNIADQSVPSAPGSGVTGFSRTGHQKYVSSDGNAYNMGVLHLPATSLPQTISSTSAATITGCSVSNIAAGSYEFEAFLQVTMGGVAGIASFQIGAPSFSSAWIQMHSAGGTTSGAGFQSAALSSVGTFSIPASGKAMCTIKAFGVFTATGAISLQAFEGTSGSSFTIATCLFKIIPKT